MKFVTHPAGPSRLHSLLALFLSAVASQAASGPEPTGDTNLTATVVSSSVPPPRFETWPVPPPRAVTATNAPAAPEAPKAAMGKTAGDKRLFEFQADNLELRLALATFARANNLNIVPDLDATGVVTLNVHDLSLERMMQAMLEANDLTWSEEQGLIRVRTVQSRNFVVDYLRLVRSGDGSSTVQLSSSSLTGGGGQGGGQG